MTYKETRKMVCVIANRIKKTGISLSEAFKKAWKICKNHIYTAVVGVMFDGRQDKLKYFSYQGEKNCSVSLVRDKSNEYDPNAVAVKMHCECKDGKRRSGNIGYLDREVAYYMAAVLDSGIVIEPTLKGIYGGIYGRSYGVRVVI